MTRRSKYGVDLTVAGKAARTYRGIVYDSRAESQYAQYLDLEVRAGTLVSWASRTSRGGRLALALHVNGTKVADYCPDFIVTLPDATTEYREVKGREDTVWPLKRKMVLAEYPDIRLVVLDVVHDRKTGEYSFVRRITLRKPRRQ